MFSLKVVLVVEAAALRVVVDFVVFIIDLAGMLGAAYFVNSFAVEVPEVLVTLVWLGFFWWVNRFGFSLVEDMSRADNCRVRV